MSSIVKQMLMGTANKEYQKKLEQKKKEELELAALEKEVQKRKAKDEEDKQNG